MIIIDLSRILGRGGVSLSPSSLFTIYVSIQYSRPNSIRTWCSKFHWFRCFLQQSFDNPHSTVRLQFGNLHMEKPRCGEIGHSATKWVLAIGHTLKNTHRGLNEKIIYKYQWGIVHFHAWLPDFQRVSFTDQNYHFGGSLALEADESSSQVANPQRRSAQQCPVFKLEELQNHNALAPRHHAPVLRIFFV